MNSFEDSVTRFFEIAPRLANFAIFLVVNRKNVIFGEILIPWEKFWTNHLATLLLDIIGRLCE